MHSNVYDKYIQCTIQPIYFQVMSTNSTSAHPNEVRYQDLLTCVSATSNMGARHSCKWKRGTASIRVTDGTVEDELPSAPPPPPPPPPPLAGASTTPLTAD